MARFNPSLLIFLRNLLFTEEELQICFIIKKGIQKLESKGSPGLEKLLLVRLVSMHNVIFRSVSILRNYRYKIIQIVRALWLAIKPFYVSVWAKLFYKRNVNSISWKPLRFASWFPSLISCSPNLPRVYIRLCKHGNHFTFLHSCSLEIGTICIMFIFLCGYIAESSLRSLIS